VPTSARFTIHFDVVTVERPAQVVGDCNFLPGRNWTTSGAARCDAPSEQRIRHPEQKCGDEMQIVEQVGGTFLLQEMKPTAMHGAVTTITSGPDTGWVLLCLSPSGSEFSCKADAGCVTVSMGLDLALRFASTLLVLASVHHTELQEHRTADDGELEVAGPPGNKVVSWTSVKGSPDVKVTMEDSNLNVRLRSSLATAIAFRILRQAGRISSGADHGV
jgi:hypothetical protein